jgi:hypothetical protein
MNRGLIGLLALVGALAASFPTLAETTSTGPIHELAAQSRPRITIYPRQVSPGRNAKRQCRSWLVKEYRVSGPVIVPREQCWWE